MHDVLKIISKVGTTETWESQSKAESHKACEKIALLA